MLGNTGGRARQQYMPCLGSAAEALLGLYRRWGGRVDGVEAEVERRLDHGGLAPGGSREGLIPLLRMRDLLRYVEAEPDLRTLKLALLDALLAKRDPARRWQAVRELLAREMPRVLDVPAEDVGEVFKREISSTRSRLSRMLQLSALLILESAGELPPPAVALRFVRGRFPESTWESPAGDGVWHPVTPLGRPEYLAIDLAEAVFRGARSDPGSIGSGKETHGQVRADGGIERVYCRLEAGEPSAQLPLLPVDAERWVPDLFRWVERYLGSEGVRQAALILAGSAGSAPGQPIVLDRGELDAACGAATRRETRMRERCLAATIALLSDVAIQRVGPGAEGQIDRVRTTRLLTVLGWEGVRHGLAGHPTGARQGGAPQDWERVTLLMDSALWDGQGRHAARHLRNVPAAVLGLSPREFPFAVGIAAWAVRQFATVPGEPVQRGAEALLHEAGLSSTPQATARLKRDLQQLRELGTIGRWRLVRVEGGGMEVRIEPPGLAAGAGPRARTALQASARLARRMRMEGGSDWAVS
jgi:hypothetical protein